MLIAAKKGKLRIHFNSYDKLIEDEITSTIFGPLRYFSATEVYDFLKNLGKSKLEKKELWPSPNDNLRVEFDFWPKILSSDNGEKEPDIIIRFKNGNDVLLCLVFEVKWGKGSCQSSIQESTGAPSQLAEQWHRISENERKHSLHVYLAWDKEKISQEFVRMFDLENGLNFRELKFSKKTWRDRLLGITWGEVAYTLQSMKLPYKSSFHDWLEEVAEFLDKFGFSKFTGFEGLVTFDVPLMHQKILFWRHFNGFNFLEKIDVGACNKDSSIFFSED